jgi:hypothetical protein
MAARPDPPESIAESATVTADGYELLEHAAPLHVIEEVGAAVSIEINCDCVASMFPALSQARYLIVVVVPTETGAE